MHLTEEQVDQLTKGGECVIHFHPKDFPDINDLVNLQAVNPGEPITSDTTLTKEQTLVVVDTASSDVTITLPNAVEGREYQVIKSSARYTLYVVPQAGETILGSTSGVIITLFGTCLHFKATTTNFWMII